MNVAAEAFGGEAGSPSSSPAQAEVAAASSPSPKPSTPTPRGSEAKEPLFAPRLLESGEVVPLRLYEGDDLAEACASSPPSKTSRVPPAPSRRCQARRAKTVYDIPVTLDGETEHRLKLFEGDALGERVAQFAAGWRRDETREALNAIAARVREAGGAGEGPASEPNTECPPPIGSRLPGAGVRHRRTDGGKGPCGCTGDDAATGGGGIRGAPGPPRPRSDPRRARRGEDPRRTRRGEDVPRRAAGTNRTRRGGRRAAGPG